MNSEKRKELFVFDLDGTLLKSNISILFYKYALKKFFFSWHSFFYCCFFYCNYKIFHSLPSFHYKIFKKVFFNRSLVELSKISEKFVQEYDWNKQLYVPAFNELKHAQNRQAYTAIFSSSPDFLVKRIAKLFKIDFVLASSYVCNEQGKCTRILNLVDGSIKKKVLRKLSNRLGIKKIYAFSDSITDINFLEMASFAFAVRPDRLLKKIAVSRNWSII